MPGLNNQEEAPPTDRGRMRARHASAIVTSDRDGIAGPVAPQRQQGGIERGRPPSGRDAMTCSVQAFLLIDGGDDATIPDIAEMTFLTTSRQEPRPEDGRALPALIADAPINDAI